MSDADQYRAQALYDAMKALDVAYDVHAAQCKGTQRGTAAEALENGDPCPYPAAGRRFDAALRECVDRGIKLDYRRLR